MKLHLNNLFKSIVAYDLRTCSLLAATVTGPQLECLMEQVILCTKGVSPAARPVRAAASASAAFPSSARSPVLRDSEVPFPFPARWTAFTDAAHMVFDDWPALRLAVEHNDGEFAARALRDETIAFARIRWAEDRALPADRVASLLSSRFSKLFPGDLKDGSAEQTARFVSTLFRQCRAGRSALADEIVRVRNRRRRRAERTEAQLQEWSAERRAAETEARMGELSARRNARGAPSRARRSGFVGFDALNDSASDEG